MRRASVLLVIAWFAWTTPPSRAEPIAVIVAEDWHDATELSLPELRAVYLGRQTRLFDRRVEPIDLAAGSRARAGFCRTALGRSESALERYWIEQALAGGALPPWQVGADQDVVRLVRERSGTIGYVAWSAIGSGGIEGIRVLPIVSDGVARSPAEAGYPVHLEE